MALSQHVVGKIQDGDGKEATIDVRAEKSWRK
jgi:hypothetical protein